MKLLWERLLGYERVASHEFRKAKEQKPFHHRDHWDKKPSAQWPLCLCGKAIFSAFEVRNS